MKYLRHYTEDGIKNLLNSNGAFFAFGQGQFNEKKQSGVNYVSCGNGLISPKSNAEVVIKGLDSVYKDGIAMDLAENGKDAIIHRELANYETQLSGHIDDTVQALADYPITEDEIREGYKVYWRRCVELDLF